VGQIRKRYFLRKKSESIFCCFLHKNKIIILKLKLKFFNKAHFNKKYITMRAHIINKNDVF